MSKTDAGAPAGRFAGDIPGYDFGSPKIAPSPVTVRDFESMKEAAGFTGEDERWLRVAGEVLTGQTKELVTKWRDLIGSLPQLARYSQGRDGQKIPSYAERSGLRLQQWVLDTCFRPYDQDWLNYQHEMALRHTSAKKNRTDGADS